MSLLLFCIGNWKTQWIHVASGLQPQIKSWNKTRIHKLLMSCKSCLYYLWHSWRLYLDIITFHGMGVASSYPVSPWFRWGSRRATCSILKIKPFDISHRLHPGNFFPITWHFTCICKYVHAWMSSRKTLFLMKRSQQSFTAYPCKILLV